MPPRKRLGQLLTELGVVDEHQLQSALGHQKQWGGKLGGILVQKGFCKEDEVITALSKHLGMPAVRLAGQKIDPRAVKFVSKQIAEKLHVFAYEVSGTGRGEVVTIAMSDPTDLSAVDQLAFHTGKRIKPMLAGDSEIVHAIQTHYAAEEKDKPPALAPVAVPSARGASPAPGSKAPAAPPPPAPPSPSQFPRRFDPSPSGNAPRPANPYIPPPIPAASSRPEQQQLEEIEPDVESLSEAAAPPAPVSIELPEDDGGAMPLEPIAAHSQFGDAVAGSEDVVGEGSAADEMEGLESAGVPHHEAEAAQEGAEAAADAPISWDAAPAEESAWAAPADAAADEVAHAEPEPGAWDSAPAERATDSSEWGAEPAPVDGGAPEEAAHEAAPTPQGEFGQAQDWSAPDEEEPVAHEPPAEATAWSSSEQPAAGQDWGTESAENAATGAPVDEASASEQAAPEASSWGESEAPGEQAFGETDAPAEALQGAWADAAGPVAEEQAPGDAGVEAGTAAEAPGEELPMDAIIGLADDAEVAAGEVEAHAEDGPAIWSNATAVSHSEAEAHKGQTAGSPEEGVEEGVEEGLDGRQAESGAYADEPGERAHVGGVTAAETEAPDAWASSEDPLAAQGAPAQAAAGEPAPGEADLPGWGDPPAEGAGEHHDGAEAEEREGSAPVAEHTTALAAEEAPAGEPVAGEAPAEEPVAEEAPAKGPVADEAPAEALFSEEATAQQALRDDAQGGPPLEEGIAVAESPSQDAGHPPAEEHAGETEAPVEWGEITPEAAGSEATSLLTPASDLASVGEEPQHEVTAERDAEAQAQEQEPATNEPPALDEAASWDAAQATGEVGSELKLEGWVAPPSEPEAEGAGWLGEAIAATAPLSLSDLATLQAVGVDPNDGVAALRLLATLVRLLGRRGVLELAEISAEIAESRAQGAAAASDDRGNAASAAAEDPVGPGDAPASRPAASDESSREPEA